MVWYGTTGSNVRRPTRHTRGHFGDDLQANHLTGATNHTTKWQHKKPKQLIKTTNMCKTKPNESTAWLSTRLLRQATSKRIKSILPLRRPASSSFLACNSWLRSGIRRHHPPQRAVLSRICCFEKRKMVIFQILLDGARSGRPAWGNTMNDFIVGYQLHHHIVSLVPTTLWIDTSLSNSCLYIVAQKKLHPFIFAITLSNHIIFPRFLAHRYWSKFATKLQRNCPPILMDIRTLPCETKRMSIYSYQQ